MSSSAVILELGALAVAVTVLCCSDNSEVEPPVSFGVAVMAWKRKTLIVCDPWDLCSSFDEAQELCVPPAALGEEIPALLEQRKSL